MANNTQNTAYQRAPRAPKKLILGNLFTDAEVRVEPEEEQKIVVAGLAEARPVKNYPDSPISRAFAVFKGEFSTLFKATLYSLIFTVPFIVIIAWFAGYFEQMVLGGVYNFMSGIGIGYNPGELDQINLSVARLYWDVKEPIFAMIAAALIFGAIGLPGMFYCAKRSFYQDYYKKITKTYWMGFAKYWFKYILCATIDILIGLAMATSIIYLLQQQTLGTAGAGAYCAVVFSFVFGLPLMTIPMIMMGLFASYNLTFGQTIKNAIVILFNNPFVVVLTGAFSAAPLLICLAGNIIAIIVYICMALFGTVVIALLWTGMAERGMLKCKDRLAQNQKVQLQQERQAKKAQTKQNPYANGNVAGAQKKKKQQAKPYQNPKKKKK